LNTLPDKSGSLFKHYGQEEKGLSDKIPNMPLAEAGMLLLKKEQKYELIVEIFTKILK